MGRGQTPTAGRKVEAGPQAETHGFKLPPILFRSSRENRGPSDAPAPANNALDPVQSCKICAGLADLCPRSARSPTKTNKDKKSKDGKMSRFSDQSLRIESADLEAADQLTSLPVYGADGKFGQLPMILRGTALSIILSSSNGRRAHTIRSKKYPPRLRRVPCLKCPSCGKWRKRLFLETDIRTGSTSFRCRGCIKDAST